MPRSAHRPAVSRAQAQPRPLPPPLGCSLEQIPRFCLAPGCRCGRSRVPGDSHRAVCVHRGAEGPTRSRPVQPAGPAGPGPPSPGPAGAAQVGQKDPLPRGWRAGLRQRQSWPLGYRPTGVARQQVLSAWQGQRSAPALLTPEDALCSCQAPGDAGSWVPIYEEESLQRAWRASGHGGLRLQCRVSRAGDSRGREAPPSLCLLPQPSLCCRGLGAGPSSTRWWPSTATQPRGPRTWTSSRGTRWTCCVKVGTHHPSHPGAGGCPGPPGTWPGTGAVASPAVDEAWLEGHREGRIGIFPKCFVAPAGGRL